MKTLRYISIFIIALATFYAEAQRPKYAGLALHNAKVLKTYLTRIESTYNDTPASKLESLERQSSDLSAAITNAQTRIENQFENYLMTLQFHERNA